MKRVAAARPVTDRGSNQYRRHGRGISRRDQQIRERVEVEAAAWAFTDGPSDGLSKQAVTVRRFDDQVRFAAHPDSSVRRSVAANRATSKDVLTVLAGDTEPTVRAAVGTNPRTAAETIEVLAWDLDGFVADRSLRNPRCSSAILAERAAEFPAAVSVNPTTPSTTLRDIVNKTLTMPQWSPAHNVNLSATVVSNLVNHPNTPQDVLTRIIYLPDMPVDIAVRAIAHPNCPEQTLERFHTEHTTEHASRYREAVADNPNCPSRLLSRLADDPNSQVRRAVARHPHTEPAVLARLVHDTNTEVRIRAVRNPSIPVAAIQQRDRQEHAAAAQVAIRRTLQQRSR